MHGNIYPIGANLTFDLRRIGGGTNTLAVKAIGLLVDEFIDHGSCPFRVTGDKIIGAGEMVPRIFLVGINGKAVSAHQKNPSTGKLTVTSGDNFLQSDPPRYITLRNSSDDVEIINVRLVTQSPGMYRLHLFIDYTASTKLKRVELPPVSICKP